MIKPNLIICDLDSSGEILLARYAKKPGYKGRTQTAPKGAKSPARKANQKFNRAETILTPCSDFFL